MNLLLAVLLANVFCQVAFYRKWLDASGALAATVLGSVILLTGGWKLTLPVIIFFITGSLFSRLKGKSVATDVKSNKPRDYVQVLCNGGLGMVCLLLFLARGNAIFISTYFLSIAVSTADTWSSEIGMRFGGKVVDILTWKSLEKGISGGISVLGTLAGFVGALSIGLLYYWLFNRSNNSLLIITTGGFAGMLLDSIIGSRFQARYRLDNGTLVEFIPGSAGAKPEKGLAWMTNDLVNLISNLAITASAIALLFSDKS
jgi:uncharacterized protein (TIGR00297 family)